MDKRTVYKIIFGIVLVGFTAYIFLTSFVIERPLRKAEDATLPQIPTESTTDATVPEQTSTDEETNASTEVPTESITEEETTTGVVIPVNTTVELSSDRYLDTDIHIVNISLT